MKISGIYKIESKTKPERIYIGSAVAIQGRWNGHLCHLRKNTHHSKKLQNHYNKYGEADLLFSILLGCEKEYLVVNEQFFIDSYKPWFNGCPKAGNCLGFKHSEESNKNKSKRQMGHETSEETRKKISESNKGKKLSAEHCRKMSESRKGKPSWNKGKKASPETIQRLSDSHKGKMCGENHPMFGMHHTKESRLKNSESHLGQPAWNKGLPQSKEQRLKNSIAKRGNKNMLGKHHSEETRKRMSENRKGIPHSEETKRKMSLAQKNMSPETRKIKSEKLSAVHRGIKMSDEFKQKIKDSWVIRKQKKAVSKLLLQTSLN